MFHFRNLWEHSNPLYPAELRILGLRILPGRFDASVFVNHGWSPRAFSKMLLSDDAQDFSIFSINTQFGVPLWLAMLVPVVLSARRKLKLVDWLPAALFVIYPLASVLLYFLIVPFWSEHRLLFPVYYLLLGGFGWSLHLLARERGELAGDVAAAVMGLGFLGHAFFFMMYSSAPLLLFVAAGVVGLMLANYPRLLEWMGRRPWVVPAAAAAVLVVTSSWWFPWLAQQRMANRSSNYAARYGGLGAAWTGLDEHTEGKPATIAYTGTSLIYPLFGPKLANRVVYVPIHPHDQPGSIALAKEPDIYRQLAEARRKEADESFWLEQFKQEQVDFLIVVRDRKLDDLLIERTFAAHHPELLRLIYPGQDVWVYVVQRK